MSMGKRTAIAVSYYSQQRQLNMCILAPMCNVSSFFITVISEYLTVIAILSLSRIVVGVYFTPSNERLLMSSIFFLSVRFPTGGVFLMNNKINK